MPRPRRDGEPPRETDRRKLTDLFVLSAKPQDRPQLIWDAKQPGLALRVRPTGKKAWKVIYRHHGRPRWLHLGDVRADRPRRRAAAGGRDVLDGDRGRGSGRQAQGGAHLRHLRRSGGAICRAARQAAQQELAAGRAPRPAPSRCRAGASSRRPPSAAADVRTMMLRIEAPILANQTLAAAIGDLRLGDPTGDPDRQSLSWRRPQSDRGARARALRRGDPAACGRSSIRNCA